MAKIRFLFFIGALATVLTGCAGALRGGFMRTANEITDTTILRTMRYDDEGNLGEEYTISIDVPKSWVGQFDTFNEGNVLSFRYITDSNRRGTIFEIYALSRSQFWMQNGSYPTTFSNILSRNQTYFAYSTRVEAHYSGLPADLYESLVAQVPEIVASFEAELIGTRSGQMGSTYNP